MVFLKQKVFFAVETTDQVSVPRQSLMWNLVKQHVCLSDEGFQEKVQKTLHSITLSTLRC